MVIKAAILNNRKVFHHPVAAPAPSLPNPAFPLIIFTPSPTPHPLPSSHLAAWRTLTGVGWMLYCRGLEILQAVCLVGRGSSRRQATAAAQVAHWGDPPPTTHPVSQFTKITSSRLILRTINRQH